VKCTNFQHNQTFWKHTTIQDFNLICDDKYKQKWTQQATFFGLLVGVFVSGLISDKIGRSKTMMIMLTMVVICGTLTSFAPSYGWFLAGIWACGFSAIGFGTVMYCWMMEILSGKEKTIFGVAPHLNFAFWGFAVAVIAYLVPDWQKMALIFSLPLIILYSVHWILPESPRWLLAQGRLEEAENIVRKIAKYNGNPLPSDFHLIAPQSDDQQAKKTGETGGIFTFLNLFKTPNMRMKTLIIYYCWFTTSMIYYGLTLNSNNVGGSLFQIYCFGKGLEFPAILLVIFLLLRAGRRLTLLILYVICGFSLLGTLLIPKEYDWALMVLNVIGRGSSTGTLALCYVYSAEIFPTVVRNVGIGSSSVWARISPMIAPYIADLSVYHEKLPLMVFGSAALIAGFLVSFLPETADHKLPDTLAEGEAMGRGDTLWSKKSEATNGTGNERENDS